MVLANHSVVQCSIKIFYKITLEASALEFNWDIKPFQNGFSSEHLMKCLYMNIKIWSAITEDKNTQMLQKDMR
jgi:hypothetical protein